VGARTWQVVGPVRVTSAGTLTGHDRLSFPPDADSNTACYMRPLPLDKQHEWNTNSTCTESISFYGRTARRRADDIAAA
jgi:hypothetical protein